MFTFYLVFITVICIALFRRISTLFTVNKKLEEVREICSRCKMTYCESDRLEDKFKFIEPFYEMGLGVPDSFEIYEYEYNPENAADIFNSPEAYIIKDFDEIYGPKDKNVILELHPGCPVYALRKELFGFPISSVIFTVNSKLNRIWIKWEDEEHNNTKQWLLAKHYYLNRKKFMKEHPDKHVLIYTSPLHSGPYRIFYNTADEAFNAAREMNLKSNERWICKIGHNSDFFREEF